MQQNLHPLLRLQSELPPPPMEEGDKGGGGYCCIVHSAHVFPI